MNGSAPTEISTKEISTKQAIFLAKKHKIEPLSRQLLEMARDFIELGHSMPETLRQYIVESLTKIVDHGESADKAFNLKRGKGERKNTTFFRDISIALLYHKFVSSRMSPKDAKDKLTKVKYKVGEEETYLGEKSIEKIITEYYPTTNRGRKVKP